MKLTIFGATGKTGQHLVEQALADGHEITVLARTPSKLTLQHARLRVIMGNVLDVQKVDEAVAGSDAVISLLGPGKNQGEHIVTRGTSHIIAAMKKLGIRRLVLAAGAGVGDSNDRPTFVDRVISFLLHLMAKEAAEDMTLAVKTVRDVPDLDWTIVRVPMLTDKPASGKVKVGYLGKGVGTQLSRADMARFMLQQVKSGEYSHLAPVISN